MDQTLNRLALGKAGPVLLLAISERSASAALAAREGGAWKLLGDAARSELGGLEGAAAAIDALNPPKKARFVLAAGSECEPLLHPAEIPASLGPEAAAEMLRWEIDLSGLGEPTSGESPDPTAWELGHAPAGSGQTAVAALRRSWLASLRELLETRSLHLAAVLPAMSLGWRLLRPSGTTGLVLKWNGQLSLTVFEKNRPEFHARYPAPASGQWPRGLVADARSFALQHLFAIGEDSADSSGSFHDPALPPTEALGEGEDWLWTGLLGVLDSCADGVPRTIPLIDGLGESPPAWKRPSRWWSAAAALLLALALPLSLHWGQQISALKREQEQSSRLLADVTLRLQAYEADAQAYELLEAELRSLEQRIEEAAQLRDRPAAAPCARVDYIADALGALAKAFAKNVKVKRFQTNFEGRVSIDGETDQDSSAQEALGHFYALLSRHPIQPAPLSTTREGAKRGRLAFLAQHSAYQKAAEPVNAALEAELRGGATKKAAATETEGGQSDTPPPPPKTAEESEAASAEPPTAKL